MEKFAQKQRELANYSGVSLAFLGDSVTQGCFETHRRAADELRTCYEQENGYHHQLAQMLATLYPLVPVNLINAGICGDGAAHALERLERDVLRFNPDMAVVCFGLNDSLKGMEGLEDYLLSMRGIFAKMHEAGIETVFMTPNMMCTYVDYTITDDLLLAAAEKCTIIQREGILEQYLEAAKALCKEYDVRVCDCYAKWKTLYQNGVEVTDLLAGKINHPTREMHKLFAVSLLETMMTE
jgi:lysophospholipase L1-like esterase